MESEVLQTCCASLLHKASIAQPEWMQLTCLSSKGSAAGKQALVYAQGCQCLEGCEVVVVDVAGLLPQLYKVLELVFMGDSLAEDARYMAHAAAVHTCLLAAAAALAAVCLYILLSTW